MNNQEELLKKIEELVKRIEELEKDKKEKDKIEKGKIIAAWLVWLVFGPLTLIIIICLILDEFGFIKLPK